MGCICSALSAALFLSVRKNIECFDKLEEIGNSVDETLDILDVYYKKIDKKSKLDVFSDDPVVRELLRDITDSRDAILVIANKIFEPLEKVPGGKE